MSPGPAAATPGTGPTVGQESAPGGGLDARYEHLRHAALHARGEAFPLGLGMLTRGGVTAWHRALSTLTPTNQHTPGAGMGTAAPVRRPAADHPSELADLPAPISAALINALAGLTLTGATSTGPAP